MIWPNNLEAMDPFDAAETGYRRALERAPGNMVVLGNYAFFLQNFRRDLPTAREFYVRALQADPADAINHTNFTGLCLVMDNHPESLHHMNEAWRLIEGKADRYTCRTLFLRAALAAVRKEDAAIYLGQLKTIFEQEGMQPMLSRNITVLEHLQKHLPADQFALFDAIYSMINKLDELAQLEAISAWQHTQAVPLSSPWP
jgi:tetratricopeptide (TPR) repeat protein